MDRIRRVDRRLAYKGAYLEIYDDTIVTPDNLTVHYDHIHHSGAAAVIPVLDDGRIMLVRQYRNSIDRYTLELPAGGIEAGEEPIAAAARECEEETGYRCGQIIPFIKVASAVAFCNEVIHVFIARQLTPTHQKLDPEEYINVETYTPDELSDKIFSCEIQDSKTVSSIMAYINRYT